MLAPALVAATIVVFASGVALLLVGHRAAPLTLIHKVSFIVWGVCFAVHFLSYLPRMLRSARADWRPRHGERLSGARLRNALLLTSTFGGLLLAVSLLSLVGDWHR
ncbi:MAG: hypothetical protein ACR2ND_10265 [Solirubrobacteraceae bacterium]